MQIVYRLEVHFSYFSLCCVIERREKKWNWFDVERDSVMTLEHQQYVCLKQRTRTMFIELFGLAWKSFRRRSLLRLFKVHDFVASFKSEKLDIPNIVWLRRWLCYTSRIFTPSHHYRQRRRLSVCKKRTELSDNEKNAENFCRVLSVVVLWKKDEVANQNMTVL